MSAYTATAALPDASPDGSRDRRRVLVSGFIGSSIEFYDFFLYATAAALIFPHVFFANLSPLFGSIAALGTFATGYLARPIGGVIFGHFGDRIGRKRMLMITIIAMGVASTLIGALPTTEMIGFWAPTLLIFLRVIQGVALGGEWGGAMLMAVEHGKQNRRGFYSSFVTIGTSAGNLLAAGAMSLVSLLPQDQLLAWGWRVPFLLSAVLLIVGLVIRTRITESPLFANAAQRGETTRVPILSVLRHEWRQTIIVIIVTAAPLAIYIASTTFFPVFLASRGFSPSLALVAITIVNAINLVWYPTCGYLSDRIGRKRLLLAGFTIGVVIIYPVFLLIGSGNPLLIALGCLLTFSVFGGPTFGAVGAFASEQYSTATRYTGASLGYQLGSTIGSGITPLVVSSLFAASGGKSVTAIAIYLGAACLIAIVATIISRETSRVDIR